MKQQDLKLFPAEDDQSKKKRRKSPEGVATTELVFSSYTGENASLFRKVIELFLPKGAKIADVTYGLGSFWREIDQSEYKVFQSDLKTGIDFRKLPYEDESMDAVVLDPPYMEGLLRSDESIAGNGTHSAFQTAYSNSQRPEGIESKWHDAVVELYYGGGLEAKRVLRKRGGIFIVKCQDEVSACVQRLTHVELILNFWMLGFYPRDLFVLTRTNKPGVSRTKKQLHARKNHSYFLVFETGATASRMNCINVIGSNLLGNALRQAHQERRKGRIDMGG
jgi:hypothetical protein